MKAKQSEINLKELVDAKMAERKVLYDQISDIDNFVKACRKICQHDWKDDGHDSHKNYFVCRVCGETDHD